MPVLFGIVVVILVLGRSRIARMMKPNFSIVIVLVTLWLLMFFFSRFCDGEL